MIGNNYQINAAPNAQEGYSGLSTVPITPKKPMGVENSDKPELISKDYANAIMAYNTPLKHATLPDIPSVDEAVRYVQTQNRFGYTYKLKQSPEFGNYNLNLYNKKGQLVKDYNWKGGQDAKNYSGRIDYTYDGVQAKPTLGTYYRAGEDRPYSVMECYEYIPEDCFTRYGLNKNTSPDEYLNSLTENQIKYTQKSYPNGNILISEYDNSGNNIGYTEFNTGRKDSEGNLMRQMFLDDFGNDERAVCIKDDCVEIYNYRNQE